MSAPVYIGEVFVDGSGTYVGDGSDDYVDWGHATGLPESGYYACDGVTITGGFAALFGQYWYSPQCGVVVPVYDFPTYLTEAIVDNSGPHGHETEKALEILGPGAPGLAGWTRNNWTPDHDSVWIYEGWFRTLDAAGFTCGLGYALAGHPSIVQGTFTITEAWQFVRFTFPWIYSTGANGVPTIQLLDDRFHNAEERTEVEVPPFIVRFDLTKWMNRYTILAKHLHLYQKIVRPGYHTHVVAGPHS